MAKKPAPTPPAPDWLKGDALARWNAVWAVLNRRRVTPGRHGDTVAAYCQAAAEYAAASRKVDELGGPVVLKRGGIAANPYAEARDRALRTMTELGKAIGLTPDAPPDEEPDVEWADYAETLLLKQGSNSKNEDGERVRPKRRKPGRASKEAQAPSAETTPAEEDAGGAPEVHDEPGGPGADRNRRKPD